MKKLFMILMLTGVLLMVSGEARADQSRHGGGYFYVTLASHGSWIDLGDGMVVWQPSFIRNGWAPYRYGEWVWTDEGWYWDSYEPFGDIVYHYGRWYNDSYYGWIWVPDDQWAPAWVEWRYDDDYIGWAPLSPYAVFSVNVGIHFTNSYYTPYTYWNFVPYRHFCSPKMYNHYLGPKVKYRVYNNTKYRTNYEYRGGNVYNRGIDRDFIQKRGNTDIRTRQIERVSDPNQINRTSERDRTVLRTYVATRDDVSRENLSNLNIKRSERNSSLDLGKVNIGRSNNTRVDDSQINRTRDDRNTNLQTDRKITTPNIRKEDRKVETNGNIRNGRESMINKDGDNRRMDSPPVVEKRNRDTELRNQQEVQKRQQVELQKKQQLDVQRNQQIDQQKKQQQEIQKRQRVETQRIQRKVEENNNRQRIEERKRNDAPKTRVEQKNDRKTESNDRKTDSGNRRR